MDLSEFFALILMCALALCGLAAWILSRRQRRAYEKLARTSTFHCLRCDSVYAAPQGSETGVCPKCGYKNPRLRF